MYFWIDTHDGAVPRVALHSCHQAGYIASSAEEAEMFAELGGESVSRITCHLSDTLDAAENIQKLSQWCPEHNSGTID